MPMRKLIDVFAYHVQFYGYESWEVFVASVQKLTRYMESIMPLEGESK